MSETKFIQFFIKLLDNKTLTLQFPTHQTLTPLSIKHKIETLTQIPTQSQKLTLNGRFLNNTTPIAAQSLSLCTINLTFSLVGGKGGFGSLLRGAATKAGQKKTNNFEACRDMSGRRLRHVNAEKRLEEWKAEEEERKLEKMAEEYLKKMEKKGKGGKKEEGAEKYVEKYREVSARCVEEVERSVGELLAAGKKRKLMEKLEGVDAKKLRIWAGKRKLGESDSDDSDSDTESDDSEAENEKSVVIDNGSQSDSSKDASSGSVAVPQSDGDHHAGGSSDSGSEEEKDIDTVVTEGSIASTATPSGSNSQVNGDSPVEMSSDIDEKIVDQREKLPDSAEVASMSTEIVVEQDPNATHSGATIVTEQLPSTSTLIEPDDSQSANAVPEVHGDSECRSASLDEGISGISNVPEVLQPLNLDDFNSAAELEVIGMERLKSELQALGLKCGGTLQERAARLFLLKTTPLEKLPKKLLVKK